ncbi:hypothetical protein [Novipirellula maiorica]|uniref:hypothetical protein n=1 Tax=Novipirellula maiorica TaxID=1265734 RepID=UPI00034953A5|nr:hypothetical protein [Rhodopirellula maiorica]
MQIAFRHSLRDALERPASTVDRIIVSRNHRGDFDWNHVNLLLGRYQDAQGMVLLGAACEGVRHTERFAVAAAAKSEAASRLSVYNAMLWRQQVPRWMLGSAAHPVRIADQKITVAVIAATLPIAEPLLDIASGCGASAIWMRHDDSLRIRNLDRVIWDDSVATADTRQRWVSRMAAIDPTGRSSHAWVANTPRYHQIAAAESAGVQLVLAKPYSIRGLTQWIGGAHQQVATQPYREKLAA